MVTGFVEMCIRDRPRMVMMTYRIPDSIRQIAMPVSYTHLDVYKRQGQ